MVMVMGGFDDDDDDDLMTIRVWVSKTTLFMITSRRDLWFYKGTLFLENVKYSLNASSL
jgi:hypothetical protein